MNGQNILYFCVQNSVLSKLVSEYSFSHAHFLKIIVDYHFYSCLTTVTWQHTKDSCMLNVLVFLEKNVNWQNILYFYMQNSVLIMYNDEFPNGTKSFTKGHTKGVLAMTQSGGFWLVHSVPMYPPSPEDDYSYPSTGEHYGQIMLCISLPVEESENLGE